MVTAENQELTELNTKLTTAKKIANLDLEELFKMYQLYLIETNQINKDIMINRFEKIIKYCTITFYSDLNINYCFNDSSIILIINGDNLLNNIETRKVFLDVDYRFDVRLPITISFNSNKNLICEINRSDIKFILNDYKKWMNFKKDFDKKYIINNIIIQINYPIHINLELYSRGVNSYIKRLKMKNLNVRYENRLNRILNIIGIENHAKYLYRYQVKKIDRIEIEKYWLIIQENRKKKYEYLLNFSRELSIKMSIKNDDFHLSIQNKNNKKMDWHELYLAISCIDKINQRWRISNALFDVELEEWYITYNKIKRYKHLMKSYIKINSIDDCCNGSQLMESFINNGFNISLKTNDIYCIYIVFTNNEKNKTEKKDYELSDEESETE